MEVFNMDKVLLSHVLYKDGMEALEGKVDITITNNGKSDEIIDELKKADGFILRIGKIDRKAMLQCKNLKVIARPGVGVDNVDVATATELGIPVVIAPGANSRSVAEHALTLILAVAKNIVDSDVETRKGNFNVREKYAAVELLGKTVGVVGYGNIGKEAAKLCAAFGMNVCIYDPFVAKNVIEEVGFKHYESLHELLRVSDVVTLHIPSTPETKGIIGVKELELMKSTAFLVNCSRGDLIDEDALYNALKAKVIAGAGLDVLKEEPMKAGHPLFSLDNVIVSPHLAAQTREATAKGVVMAVEGTLAILHGEKWPYVYNKEVYNHPKWKNR
jgi:D-3-phosphoglycerate dehydrogenase